MDVCVDILFYMPGAQNNHLFNGCFNWMMNPIFTWKIGVSPTSI